MSAPGEQAALLELNLRRETWCQVEAGPRQSWDRVQRRHYRGHLKTSPGLLQALRDQPQRRTGRLDQPVPVPLVQRRHYEDSYKSHLV